MFCRLLTMNKVVYNGRPLLYHYLLPFCTILDGGGFGSKLPIKVESKTTRQVQFSTGRVQ